LGLTPGILKRPEAKFGRPKTSNEDSAKSERELFSSLTGATATHLIIERKIK